MVKRSLAAAKAMIPGNSANPAASLSITKNPKKNPAKRKVSGFPPESFRRAD
jgi:hypothetical protein